MSKEEKKVPYDTSFDKAFDEISDLKWYPWVGKDYKNTIILGESHYAWNYENNEEATWINNKNFTRLHRTEGAALNTDVNSPYFRNFERAYFGASQIERYLANSLWHSVAHFNLVQRAVSSKHERPTREDYKNGWEVAWSVANILNSENIVVFGTEPKKIQTFWQLLSKHKIKADVIESDDLLGSRTKGKAFIIENSNIKKVVFIKHPSSFFKWDKCHEFFEKVGLKII